MYTKNPIKLMKPILDMHERHQQIKPKIPPPELSRVELVAYVCFTVSTVPVVIGDPLVIGLAAETIGLIREPF